MFQTEVVQKLKTHVFRSVTFYNRVIYKIMWKDAVCRVVQATDGIMAHAHCMLDNQDYTHILRICNNNTDKQHFTFCG